MFRRPHSAPVARSCSELNTTSTQAETEHSSAAAYWKSRSLEELPDEVAACFEDSSVLGRLQARVLRLFGRASRYKLNSPVNTGSSFMSLDALKQRLSHVRKRWASHHRAPADPCTTPNASSSSPNCSNGVGGAGTPAYGTTGQLPQGLRQRLEADQATSQRYSANAVDTSADDAELLQQYMSLYNLAMDRKNCNHLRRIRDSLATKARSPPPAGRPASPSNLLVEREALRNFLLDIGFVQYYSLFNRHGYDLPTAAHMDPLDLAAIGITEPLHRMAIKFELDQVPIQPLFDCSTVPETIQEWLESLRLEDYVENFQQNGIYCPLAALGLTKRDLQLMGVYMLGHRKKLMLAIEALKETLLKTT